MENVIEEPAVDLLLSKCGLDGFDVWHRGTFFQERDAERIWIAENLQLLLLRWSLSLVEALLSGLLQKQLAEG
jgi:hypothetical protein